MTNSSTAIAAGTATTTCSASLEVGIASLQAISGFHGIPVKLAAARRVLELQPDPASPWRQGACWALAYSLYLSDRPVEARARAEETVRPGARARRSSPPR